MSYLWGDLGVVPSESCFSQHGLISLHYAKSGGFYPVGGASEFALSMVPAVERAGGKVLVRANVESILHNGRKVMGGRVRKGNTSLGCCWIRVLCCIFRCMLDFLTQLEIRQYWHSSR